MSFLGFAGLSMLSLIGTLTAPIDSLKPPCSYQMSMVGMASLLEIPSQVDQVHYLGFLIESTEEDSFLVLTPYLGRHEAIYEALEHHLQDLFIAAHIWQGEVSGQFVDGHLVITGVNPTSGFSHTTILAGEANKYGEKLQGDGLVLKNSPADFREIIRRRFSRFVHDDHPMEVRLFDADKQHLDPAFNSWAAKANGRHEALNDIGSISLHIATHVMRRPDTDLRLDDDLVGMVELASGFHFPALRAHLAKHRFVSDAHAELDAALGDITRAMDLALASGTVRAKDLPEVSRKFLRALELLTIIQRMMVVISSKKASIPPPSAVYSDLVPLSSPMAADTIPLVIH